MRNECVEAESRVCVRAGKSNKRSASTVGLRGVDDVGGAAAYDLNLLA